MWTRISITALFKLIKIQKQTKCPSMVTRKNKVSCSHTVHSKEDHSTALNTEQICKADTDRAKDDRKYRDTQIHNSYQSRSRQNQTV